MVVERTTLVERFQFLSHRVEHLTHENAMLSATLRAQNDPGGETTHYLKLEGEQAPSYTAHWHAPDILPPSITPAKWYLLWALLGIIFFGGPLLRLMAFRGLVRYSDWSRAARGAR